MNASDLNETLNGITSGKTLAEIISKEVEIYKLLFQKKGSSISLYFNEDKVITLSSSSIKKLLNETYNGNLSNVHLAYICDCLTLGEKVVYESEFLENLIFSLADPEINGGFKKPEEISSLLNKFT